MTSIEHLKKEILQDLKRIAPEKDHTILDELLEEYGRQSECEYLVNKWAKTLNELVNWANNDTVED